MISGERAIELNKEDVEKIIINHFYGYRRKNRGLIYSWTVTEIDLKNMNMEFIFRISENKN